MYLLVRPLGIACIDDKLGRVKQEKAFSWILKQIAGPPMKPLSRASATNRKWPRHIVMNEKAPLPQLHGIPSATKNLLTSKTHFALYDEFLDMVAE